jgi:hypothetical protein
VVITNKRNEITLSETVRKLLPHFLAALWYIIYTYTYIMKSCDLLTQISTQWIQ